MPVNLELPWNAIMCLLAQLEPQDIVSACLGYPGFSRMYTTLLHGLQLRGFLLNFIGKTLNLSVNIAGHSCNLQVLSLCTWNFEAGGRC